MADYSDISDRITELVNYFADGKNTKFADLVGTSEANIRNYRNGMSPKFDFICSVLDKLEINYDWFLFGKGLMLPNKKMENQIIVSQENEINIPIIDISMAAGLTGFINGNNVDIIGHISLPSSMLKRGGVYCCGRVRGESMSPTLFDGNWVVLRLLDASEWMSMRDEHVYNVVTSNEGGNFLKRIKNRFEKGFIVCMSDNIDKNNYPNFILQSNEIIQIWHAEWNISAKMPNINETYYSRLKLLEDRVDEMSGVLKNLNP